MDAKVGQVSIPVEYASQLHKQRSIEHTLEEDTQCEFLDTPLSEAMSYFSGFHEIPIVIDQRALEEIGLSTDAPVAKKLRDVTLRSALELVLRDLGLTTVIRNEVLMVTTPEEAETRLTTRIYLLKDLTEN